MSSEARVAVVGGGPAGLTAAHRLQQAGLSVVLFEARPRVGGRIRTDEIEGFRIDIYTQLIGSQHTEILHLLREVGLADDLVRVPGRDALWRKGRLHEVVYGSVTSMLSTGAVPMATKLVMGTKYLRFLDRHADDLDMHALERAAAAGLDRESVAEWGKRELGGDFVEYLAYPLLASACGITPEATSAALYHMFARYGMDVTMYSLRGGMGRLAEVLAQRLVERGAEVRTGTEVRRVEVEGQRFRVSTDDTSEAFEGVVLCIPGIEVPLIVPDLPDAARSWFSGVRYQPLASLALLLDEPADVRFFGLSFPRLDSRVVSTVCVMENKLSDAVPDGKGLLLVFPAPDAVRLFLESEPPQVLAAALPDLQLAFPTIKHHLRRAKLYRWPVGGPVFYPGYLNHLLEFRRGLVEGDGRMVFGGGYLTAPISEGSVLAGRRAAERLLARLTR
jgi:protoporphyrinogen/coproporphyrinogen III oxidase